MNSQKIKIVVTGGHGSGKSTFIRTLSDPWTSDPSQPPPIQDFGRIQIDDLGDTPLTIFLIGTLLGRENSLIRDLRDELLYVVMVNSADSSTFDQARATIALVEHHSNYSYVVAASFQDLERAWSVDDLRLALAVPKNVPMVACASWDFDSCRGVLLALLEKATGTR